MTTKHTHSSRRRFLARTSAFAVGIACSPLLRAQRAASDLGDGIAVIDAGCNVLARRVADGLVLVDSGATPVAAALQAQLTQLGGGRVHTLFNTHWHADQCGNNRLFGEQGAAIIAHEKTRLHLGTSYYLPREDFRLHEAQPAAALPTQTFHYDAHELIIGNEAIEYGYLMQAHTDGDIYVFLREANVIAVGDVVSPLRDPALDWYGGGWIGGRVDALAQLLELIDDETRVVPAYGPVVSKAEVQAEHDLMAFLYDKMVDLVREGMTPENMLDDGFMNELPRRFDDPYRFLYDASKSLWGHHNKLAPNVV